MITIATVQVTNYCGRGAEYVAKLFDGVSSNMPAGIDWRGACLTDDAATLPAGIEACAVEPGLVGWWNKINLFKPGVFKRGDRVLFFDLDTIILGDLTDFARYRGRFAAMRDPLGYSRIASAVMAWEAGTVDHVWTQWDAAGRPSFDPHGDQGWIGSMLPDSDYWQDLLPGQLVSFKKDCWLSGKIPDDARVLMFHGHPRPHECAATFVRKLWNPNDKMTAPRAAPSPQTTTQGPVW